MLRVSFWKPRYIPSADSLHITDHKLEALKVQHGDCIEPNIEQDQGPFEESITGVGWEIQVSIKKRTSLNDLQLRTTGNLVHLVLNEVVDQGHQCSKEEASHDLAVFDSPAVVRAQGEAAQCPWQGGNKIGDHKNVVPVVVIGRGNIGPSTASQSSEDSHTSNDLRQGRIGTRGQHVPQENESEARAGGDGNKDLEEGSFGVSIANCCGDGGKPFIGVAVVFILDDFMVMQCDTDNQSAEEGRIREDSVSPCNPFAVELC